MPLNLDSGYDDVCLEVLVVHSPQAPFGSFQNIPSAASSAHIDAIQVSVMLLHVRRNSPARGRGCLETKLPVAEGIVKDAEVVPDDESRAIDDFIVRASPAPKDRREWALGQLEWRSWSVSSLSSNARTLLQPRQRRVGGWLSHAGV